MSKENKRVLLGMSGGTDSSVAAMLLQESGYQVTGVTFRFYEKDNSMEYLRDAKELAASLGIEHITYDARDVFQEHVVDYFVKEYMDAHTPVPCVICNNTLKWPLLAKIADEMGIWHISTGHYVRKEKIGENYHIKCAVDKEKDQSFFLWGLSQDILQRMALPMGEVTKKEARRFAAAKGYDKVSKKKDSIGVCFCPFDYQGFLKKYVGEDTIQRGRFIDETGRFIGWHNGYPYYTIGQRRGLGIHLNRAVFVKEINKEKNEIVLGALQSLERNEMYLKTPNIVNEDLLLNKDDVIVKIRYRKQANTCTVTAAEEGHLCVKLHQPLTAVAPGQAAAFYRGDVVLGGGIIVE